MAKRFGRNQKRRLTNQITYLEKKLAEKEKELKNEEERGIQNRLAIEDIASLVGFDFFGMHPRVRNLHLDKSVMSIAVPVTDITTPDGLHSLRRYVRRLHRLIGDVKFSQTYGSMIHIRFTLADKSVSYALDRSVLENAPREVLIRRIAREMAEHLIQDNNFGV